LVFLAEFVKQHGHCVVPTHYAQNQQLTHWAKYVEIEVVLTRASTEVVHPQEMEPFDVVDIIDPQEAEERSIIIVKPTKVIYGNISLRIDIAQTKKAPTQVQKPFVMTLEFAQKSRQSPHKG
jgi:hypothetical protein